MKSSIYENQPSNNLGAKFLDEKQMEVNFPDYRDFMDRIESRRNFAKAVSDDHLLQGHLQGYPQMYENVFAILGGRGSGKTSVIQTIHEQLLQKDDNGDIVLPIIIPETISDKHCSILGWIMATVEQVIDDIESQFQSLENSRGGLWVCSQMGNKSKDFFKDCHLRRDNKLREQYESLKRDCIPDHGITSAFSYDDMVGLQVHLSQKQFALIRNLNAFWDDVTAYWKAIKSMQKLAKGENISEDGQQYPLIILMFDDVDLVPERSLELLNSTFQYFTNPNIVLIVTAAEKVLEQVIWTKMLERMVGSNYRSLFTDYYSKDGLGVDRKENMSLASIDKMAREYYDKVVPPVNRFYLRRYRTIIERKRYCYATNSQSFLLPREEVSLQLDAFLVKQIRELSGNSSDDLFICDKNDNIYDAYLLMFGDKSRNIANACLAILNCVSRLKACIESSRKTTEQALARQIYDALRQLLHTLISSNRSVKNLGEQALGLITLSGDTVVINIAHVWDLYVTQREIIIGRQSELSDNDAEIETGSRIHEHVVRSEGCETLGKLYAQIAILLVMLRFVDQLLNLTYEQISGSSTGDKNYRACGEVLANIINPTIKYTFRNKDVSTRWSWLTLFPKKADILIRSPYALEHVDHFIRFELTDTERLHEYLMDTFYCSTYKNNDAEIHGEDVENLIQQGFCAPKALLMKGMGEEKPWVESVLAILFLRYSRIQLIDSSFLHFEEENRNVLELFDFGGNLNRRIKTDLSDFLKRDLSCKALEEDITNFFNELSAIDYNWEGKYLKKIVLRGTDPIGKVFGDYNKCYSEDERKHIAWCLIANRLTCASNVTAESFPRWLIHEVEDSIASVTAILKNESGMNLTLEVCRSLLALLDDIPILEDNVPGVRKTCKEILEETEKHLASTPSDGSEKGRAEWLPLTTLMSYISTLSKEIFRLRRFKDDTVSYWTTEIVRGYFKLSGLLVPSFKSESERPIFTYQKDGLNQDYQVSLNTWVVLTLSMVEHMLPMYFAAKMIQQYQESTEKLRCEMSSSYYIEQDRVNTQLKEMYHNLLRDENSGSLGTLMKSVRDRVVTIYIEYLEGVEYE